LPDIARRDTIPLLNIADPKPIHNANGIVLFFSGTPIYKLSSYKKMYS